LGKAYTYLRDGDRGVDVYGPEPLDVRQE